MMGTSALRKPLAQKRKLDFENLIDCGFDGFFLHAKVLALKLLCKTPLLVFIDKGD